MSEDLESQIKELESAQKWVQLGNIWLENAEKSIDKAKKTVAYLNAANYFIKESNFKNIEKATDIYNKALHVMKKQSIADKKKIASECTKQLEKTIQRKNLDWTTQSVVKANIHHTLFLSYDILDKNEERDLHASSAADIFLKEGKAVIEKYSKKEFGNKELKSFNNIITALKLLKTIKQHKKIEAALEFLFEHSTITHNIEAFMTTKQMAVDWLKDFDKGERTEKKHLFSTIVFSTLLQEKKAKEEEREEEEKSLFGQIKSKIKEFITSDDEEIIEKITSEMLEWEKIAFTKQIHQEEIASLIYDITQLCADYRLKNIRDFVNTTSEFYRTLEKEERVVSLLEKLSKDYIMAEEVENGLYFTEKAVKLNIDIKKEEDAATLLFSISKALGGYDEYQKAISYLDQAIKLTKQPELVQEIYLLVQKFIATNIDNRNTELVEILANSFKDFKKYKKQEKDLPAISLRIAKSYEVESIEEKTTYVEAAFEEALKFNKSFIKNIYNYLDSFIESVINTRKHRKYSASMLLVYKDLLKKEKSLEAAILKINTFIPKLLENDGIKEVMELNVIVQDAVKDEKYKLASEYIMKIANNMDNINRPDISIKLYEEAFDTLYDASMEKEARKVVNSWHPVILRLKDRRDVPLRSDSIQNLIDRLKKIQWDEKLSDVCFTESKFLFRLKKYANSIDYINKAISYLQKEGTQKRDEIAEFANTRGKLLLDQKKEDLGFSLMEQARTAVKKTADLDEYTKLAESQIKSLGKRDKVEHGFKLINALLNDIEDKESAKIVGNTLQSCGDYYFRIFRDEKALKIYDIVFNVYKDYKIMDKDSSLAKTIEDKAMKLSTDKNQSTLYRKYFDFAAKTYKELSQEEELGDLYLKEMKRILDTGSIADIKDIARKAAESYASSDGSKTEQVVKTLSSCSRALVNKREFVKASELMEESADMLIESNQEIVAADFLKEQALYLIENKAIDAGIDLLHSSADLYYKNKDKINSGLTLFEGVKVLVDQDQYVQAIANVSRSISLIEEDELSNAEEHIKDIADECVQLANRLTERGNDYAAKLFINKSKEIYESGLISIDERSDQVFENYSDNLLDKMTKNVRKTTRRRRKKRR